MQFEPAETTTFLTSTIIDGQRRRAAADKPTRIAAAEIERLLTDAVRDEEGVLLPSGAGFRAAFSAAPAAVRAALKAQMAVDSLARSGAEGGIAARVRIALHSGPVDFFGGHFAGPAIARAIALGAAGHGGQILVSDAAAALARGHLPYEVTLRDLGSHGLPDSPRPLRIWQLCHPDLPYSFPPLPLRSPAAGNIPVYTTEFVGKRGEIARLVALIASGRPVTIVGEPGAGKSRLAHEVGFAALGTYSDGVWNVGVESLPDASCLIGEVGRVLGIDLDGRDPALDALVRRLREQRLLLILDGCDDARGACSALVRGLSASCPNVAILATGGAPIGLESERVHAAVPLSLPQPGAGEAVPLYELARSEAIRLFLNHARSRSCGLRMDAERAAIARLCGQVEGCALAVELAAARAADMPAAEIADYLAAASAPVAAGDVPAAAPTDPLSVLIDWTYGLLSAPQKLLLLRATVFADGFELADAVAVCADTPSESASEAVRIEAEAIPALIDQLVRLCLIHRFEAQGSDRYTLPSLVRTYCELRRRRMSDDRLLRARHARHYFTFAQNATVTADQERRDCALEALSRSGHNLYAALRSTIEEASGPGIGVRPGAIERMLLFAAAASDLCGRAGDCPALGRLVSAALNVPGAERPTRARADALLGAARLARIGGERRVAAECVDGAVAIYRQADDNEGVARALRVLADFAMEISDPWESTASSPQPDRVPPDRALERAGSPPRGRAGAQATATPGGDDQEGRAVSHEIAMGEALLAMGRAALERGDPGPARVWLADCLDLWRRHGDLRRTAWTLEAMAKAACMENRPQWAATLYLAACRLWAQVGAPASEEEKAERRAAEEWIRQRIDAALVESAAREDGGLEIDQAIAATYGPALRIVEGGMAPAAAVIRHGAATATH
ncbi:MAG TPA: hypothetical protein VKT77_13005 [Chthonomonadaceae bacterium]|nr:hypothetical protein [Chthonomonadaceae bacterium]